MYRDVIGLLSCLKGEKLSLLLQFEQAQPCVREIWVTDPNNLSWSKLFKVDTGPAADLAFSSSGFFIDEEKKVAMVFDKVPDTRHTLNVIGDPGFFTQVDVDPLIERVVPSGDLVHAHLCSYVPSLVQVQIKKRFSKRKQPSRLELRPCQQNKSRRLDHQEEEEEQVKKRVFKRKLNQVVLDDDWLERSKLELRPCQQNKSRRLDHEEEEEQVKKRVFKRKLNQVILDDDWPESSKLELRPCQQNKSRRLDHEEEEEQVILDHDWLES